MPMSMRLPLMPKAPHFSSLTHFSGTTGLTPSSLPSNPLTRSTRPTAPSKRPSLSTFSLSLRSNTSIRSSNLFLSFLSVATISFACSNSCAVKSSSSELAAVSFVSASLRAFLSASRDARKAANVAVSTSEESRAEVEGLEETEGFGLCPGVGRFGVDFRGERKENRDVAGVVVGWEMGVVVWLRDSASWRRSACSSSS